MGTSEQPKRESGFPAEPESGVVPVQYRGARERGAPARTELVRELVRRHRESIPYEYPDVERPRTWGECVEQELGTRQTPCGFVSCQHHLYLDVTQGHGVRLNFPDKDPDEIRQTCSLRVAHDGGSSLGRVALLTNLTRERVRQIEEKALAKVRSRLARLDAGETLRNVSKPAPRRNDLGLTRGVIEYVREHPGCLRVDVIASMAELGSNRSRSLYATIRYLIAGGRLRQDRRRLWIR
jgi:hypothetical protein